MRPSLSVSRSSPVPSLPPLWVVAGGKGGVGRSLLVANMGIHLARRGKRVTVVDFDLEGPNLHGYLGLGRLPRIPTRPGERGGPSPAFNLFDTSVPGLKLVPGSQEAPATAQRGQLVERFLRDRGALRCEVVLVDCGSGRSPDTLDLFLASSLGILVGTPEPISIESIYLFTESLMARLLERSLAPEALRPLTKARQAGTKSNLAISFRSAFEQLREPSPASCEDILRALASLRLRLILNQVRTGGEAELGRVLRAGFQNFYGLELSPVNSIEFDLAVIQSLQKRKSLSQQYPNSAATLGIEKAASSLMESSTESESISLPLATPLESLNHYQMLGVPADSSSKEIQEAYELARRSFDPESPYHPPFLRPEEGQRVGNLVEVAYRTLIFVESRAEYDRKLVAAGILREEEVRSQAWSEFGTVEERALEDMEKQGAESTPGAGGQPPARNSSSPPALAPGRGLPVTGPSLREHRLASGLSLETIVAKTKIRSSILTALEEDRLADLPEPVFLKAFLRQLAGCLGLDPDIICQEYMDRYSQSSTTPEQA